MYDIIEYKRYKKEKKMTREELCKKLNVSEATVRTNFPSFAVAQLKKGLLIEREGKGFNTNYTIKKVNPQEIERQFFSRRNKRNILENDLEGEIWKTLNCSKEHEISNLGRIRRTDTKEELKGVNQHGYIYIDTGKFKEALHRLVLKTFVPREDAKNLTVDHINGNRLDNRLENLRWCTKEENISFMMQKRKELNIELTRLISKYGSYDKVLKILQML